MSALSATATENKVMSSVHFSKKSYEEGGRKIC